MVAIKSYPSSQPFHLSVEVISFHLVWGYHEGLFPDFPCTGMALSKTTVFGRALNGGYTLCFTLGFLRRIP
jgi:hypothetical protein